MRPLLRLGESAALDLAPGLAAVRRLPQRRARTAALEEIRAARPLPRRRVERVRIARVHRDVDEARLVADELAQLPGLSAVDRLVESAFRVRGPGRADRRDVRDVRIRRMNDDASDVLRLLETDRLPGDAAVDRLVHAPARRDAVARVALTRSDVDDLRIARRDRDVADRCDRHVIPQRDERRAGVDRLPHAAGGAGRRRTSSDSSDRLRRR